MQRNNLSTHVDALQLMTCSLSKKIMFNPYILTRSYFQPENDIILKAGVYELDEIVKLLDEYKVKFMINTKGCLTPDLEMKNLIEDQLIASPGLWDQVYESEELKQQLIYLLEMQQENANDACTSLLHILKQDPRFLKEKTILKYGDNLLTFACKYATLDMISIILNVKFPLHQERKKEANSYYNCLVLVHKRFGFEGKYLMAEHLGYPYYKEPQQQITLVDEVSDHDEDDFRLQKASRNANVNQVNNLILKAKNKFGGINNTQFKAFIDQKNAFEFTPLNSACSALEISSAKKARKLTTIINSLLENGADPFEPSHKLTSAYRNTPNKYRYLFDNYIDHNQSYGTPYFFQPDKSRKRKFDDIDNNADKKFKPTGR